MAAPEPKQTREQRLAARLRENLKRRKVQARAIKLDADKAALPNAPLSNGETER